VGAQGTASLTFGAFPGSSDASVAVTGQAAILAGSLVEAWLMPAATADHSADEHWVESIQVRAGNVVAGTGFTIWGWNTSQLSEPVSAAPPSAVMHQNGTAVVLKTAQPGAVSYGGGAGTRLYGAWNIAWVWNAFALMVVALVAVV
jgi:hypothetical protein